MASVVVAGSINMDIVVTAARRPAVGETVMGEDVRFLPGGKGANQAVAAARLGAPTALVGCVGADAFARDLRAFLRAEGVGLDHVAETAAAPTGVALVTLAEGDNSIVVVAGANGRLGPDDVARAVIGKGDVLACQFEIPQPAIAAFLARGRAAGARTVLNPSPVVAFDRSLLQRADVIVLNEIELGLLAARPLAGDSPDADLAEAMGGLRAFAGQAICLTLGPRGALILAGRETAAIAGRRVEVVDTTGAGDCFVGALAARLAGGESIQQAADYANRAAALSVRRLGAGVSMPTAAEVASADA